MLSALNQTPPSAITTNDVIYDYETRSAGEGRGTLIKLTSYYRRRCRIAIKGESSSAGGRGGGRRGSLVKYNRKYRTQTDDTDEAYVEVKGPMGTLQGSSRWLSKYKSAAVEMVEENGGPN